MLIDTETKPVEPEVKPVETGEVKPVTPADDQTTKIVSERIKTLREKDRTELAKALGFDSWETALNSGISNKMLNAGIDPKVGTPIIEELVNNHPAVVKAKEVLAKEETDLKQAGLTALNVKYGLNLTFDTLDQNVKKLIDTGLSVENAYMAYHYSEMPAVKLDTEVINKQQKGAMNHMTSTPGAGVGSGGVQEPEITAFQMDAVRKMLPNITEDEVKKFIKSHNL